MLPFAITTIMQAPTVETALHLSGSGKALFAEVSFRIPNGYHIYGVNPGDTGIPTKIEWSAPKGWKVQELAWPVPTVIQAEGLISYGYENKVSVYARISPGSQSGVVSAKVSWLVCKETCTPGNKTLSRIVKPGSYKEFDMGSLRTLPQAPVGWQLTAHRTDKGASLMVKTSSADNNLSFISLDTGVFENTPPVPGNLTAGQYSFDLKRSQYASGPIKRVYGLVLSGSKAFLVNTPIR